MSVSRSPASRARDVAIDLLALLWIIGCLALGLMLYGDIAAIGRSAGSMRDSAAAVVQPMTDAVQQISDLPLVGEYLPRALEQTISFVRDVFTTTDETIHATKRLAVVAGAATAGVPALSVAILWIRHRIRRSHARQTATGLARHPHGARLLAAAAVSHPTTLVVDIARSAPGEEVGPQDALAMAELRRLGLRARPDQGRRPSR